MGRAGKARQIVAEICWARNSAWLEAEFHGVSARFGARHRQMLRRLGVPDDIMLHLPGIGVSAIEVDGEFWQPTEHGDEAFIVPAFAGAVPSFVKPVDDPEPPVDLIAIFPDEPDRWWWRTGVADVLGADRIASAHTWGRPVHLVPDPLAWLRRQGDAVCLLTDDAVLLLIGAETVIAESLALAERIDWLLRRPPAAMPQILVATEAPHGRRD